MKWATEEKIERLLKLYYMDENEVVDFEPEGMKVAGKIDGFDVEFFFSARGLLNPKDSVFSKVEIGAFQYCVSLLKEHGLTPKYEQRAGPPRAEASWKCPIHGEAKVTNGTFGIQCSAWEEATSEERPSWANSEEPKNNNGIWKWYCKHRPARDTNTSSAKPWVKNK